jgi:hypothetical protein
MDETVTCAKRSDNARTVNIGGLYGSLFQYLRFQHASREREPQTKASEKPPVDIVAMVTIVSRACEDSWNFSPICILGHQGGMKIVEELPNCYIGGS